MSDTTNAIIGKFKTITNFTLCLCTALFLHEHGADISRYIMGNQVITASVSVQANAPVQQASNNTGCPSNSPITCLFEEEDKTVAQKQQEHEQVVAIANEVEQRRIERIKKENKQKRAQDTMSWR